LIQNQPKVCSKEIIKKQQEAFMKSVKEKFGDAAQTEDARLVYYLVRQLDIDSDDEDFKQLMEL